MGCVPPGLLATLIIGVAPVAASAQSDEATASVTVSGSADVTVVNTAGLEFGTRVAGGMIHSSDVPTAAIWNVVFRRDGEYVFTFTLPSQLSTGAGLSVPISYGELSGSTDYLLGSPFDPATPVSMPVSVLIGLEANIRLGADVQGNGTGDVSVDLSGAAAGTYTGTITLTVAPI